MFQPSTSRLLTHLQRESMDRSPLSFWLRFGLLISAGRPKQPLIKDLHLGLSPRLGPYVRHHLSLNTGNTTQGSHIFRFPKSHFCLINPMGCCVRFVNCQNVRSGLIPTASAIQTFQFCLAVTLRVRDASPAGSR
jgi:hypothetical protein